MARIESLRPWSESDRNDILFKRKGKKERKEEKRKEKRERKTQKPRRDGSVRKEQTMEFPFAFGYIWNGRKGREAEAEWKKDGKDESEALQLGGVVLN